MIYAAPNPDNITDDNFNFDRLVWASIMRDMMRRTT